MKHQLIKTLVPLALSAIVLAGCGESKGTSEEKQSEHGGAKQETSGKPEDVDLAKDPYGKYQMPVSLSVLSIDLKDSVTDYDSSKPERKSASQNAWIDAYEKYLNIKVDRQVAEDDTALSARINTSMASNTLPDIMIVSKEMFYTLAENDVLLDLSESYKQYSTVYGRLLSEAVSTYPESLLTGKYDGKLLGFPEINDSYIDTEVLFIRKDWLDKINMKAPTTMAELEAVAKAFNDNKLGGDNTIGLGITDISRSMIAPYGAVMTTWNKGNDGKYVYANTTEPMKQGLLNLQKFYKEGLIKQDFAVTNILDEEVSNGRVGMFYGPTWNAVTSVKASLMNDTNAEWVSVRIPSLDGKPVRQWTNNKIFNYFVVSKNCKNPEALFRMIELELHMYYEPSVEEEKDYIICEDGYKMFNFRIFRNFNRPDLGFYRMELIREGVKNNTAVSDMSSIARAEYEQVLKGINGEREHLGMAMAFLESFPIASDLRKENYLVSEYDGPLTENMTLYQKTINEALDNEYLKIIMGDDISNFDKAVKNWYDNGGQQITEEINQYYQGLGK